MQKSTLHISGTREIFFEDTALIAIVSALKSHLLCRQLNYHFDINFIRVAESDICLHKKNITSYYPHYIYEIPNCNVTYRLYNLKFNKEFLLTDLKQLDYIWLIKSPSYQKDAQKITTILKNLPEISLAHIIQIDQIKTFDNLMV